MGRFDNYQEYLKYVNPNSQEGRQVNKYTGGNYNPYGFNAATGGYEAISNTIESPIDMTQYMQQPDLMTDLSSSLSTATTANKILGTKIGGKSIGSKIAPNISPPVNVVASSSSNALLTALPTRYVGSPALTLPPPIFEK